MARTKLHSMQRIALDALEFADDDEAFHQYATKHRLTVNEVVYYLNAYEYGGMRSRRSGRPWTGILKGACRTA